MENYFQPKENLKTEENINDMQGTVDAVEGDVIKEMTVGFAQENSDYTDTNSSGFIPIALSSNENLQEKADNFVSISNVECNVENSAEAEIKNRIESEAGNSVNIIPRENCFQSQSGANVTAFNKTRKQSTIKKAPFIFSMLGLLLAIFYIGLPFAITGLVMTTIQKNKGEIDELTKTSFVLSFAGIAVGLFTLILFVFCLIF